MRRPRISRFRLSAPFYTLREAGVLEVVLTHGLVSGIPAQTLEAGTCKVLTRIEKLGIPLPGVNLESVAVIIREVGTGRTR